jgi:hypothetical protein
MSRFRPTDRRLGFIEPTDSVPNQALRVEPGADERGAKFSASRYYASSAHE